MTNTIFNGIIRLRKDTEANFNQFASTLILADGEVALVETAKGIRIKVGDGSTTFANLEYIDAQEINNSIEHGYFLNGKFYTDSTYTVELIASVSKVYIDKNSDIVYTYNGSKYVSINDTLPNATSEVAGIMKLYSNKGNEINGTMTQKAITENLNTKFEVEVDEESETAIFSITL